MAVLSISSNVSSLQTQRQLSVATRDLTSSLTRLSSGLRINRASDDAAGLAIASGLNTDLRVYEQGIRNINDAVSALSIAQGALSELRNITIRQMELAEQAANGVYTSKQRTPLHREANALVAEFNRIVSVTEFNGQKLIDTSLSSLRVQSGYGTDGALFISMGGQLAQDAGTGSFQSVTSTAGGPSNEIEIGDFNGDGYVDFIQGNTGSIALSLGNGNGTFKAFQLYGTGSSIYGTAAGDFDGDGYLDAAKADQFTGLIQILLGNGNGSFKAEVVYSAGMFAPRWMSAADLNQDGATDLLVESNLTGGNTFNILFGNGNGSFRAPVAIAAGVDPAENAGIGDVNGDGITDLAICNYTADTVSILIGNGNGSFKPQIVVTAGTHPSGALFEDFNGDGKIDLATSSFNSACWGINFGNGDGTFSSFKSFAASGGPSDIKAGDINKDGFLDIVIGENSTHAVRVYFGNGDGTFKPSISTVSTSSDEDLQLADLNGDNVLDVLASNYSAGGVTIHISATEKTSTEEYLNLRTAEESRQTLTITKRRLTAITNELGAIGSYESRFQSAINTLSITRENYSAAASQITDIDTAEETGQLARRRILQQAGVAILAQANSAPAIALSLLSSI